MIDKAELDQLLDHCETPVLFLSQDVIRDSYDQLQMALENVKLYYALKSNAHPAIIEELKGTNCGFDVCSDKELDLVQEAGILPENCIHTHPIKTDRMIRKAWGFGIRTFVIDNTYELKKFNGRYDELKLLIRVSIRNAEAKSDLSKKFGVCRDEEVMELAMDSKLRGVKEIGLSFHCGSQAEDPLVFVRAIERCKNLVQKLELEGIRINCLDLGGGFPISYDEHTFDLQDYCCRFTEDLDFFSDKGIRLIAEPGRCISGESMCLVTRIIGKSIREDQIWYYIDDGVYNSFSGRIYDYSDYPLFIPSSPEGVSYSSVIAGPTCDSIDVVKPNIWLPSLEIGEALTFQKMGAYTSESASCFNGFEKTRIAVIEKAFWR